MAAAEATFITQGGGAAFIGATTFFTGAATLTEVVVFTAVEVLAAVADAQTTTELPEICEPTLSEPALVVEVQAACAGSATNEGKVDNRSTTNNFFTVKKLASAIYCGLFFAQP
ncbi:MAG: hypothetical protein RLZZ471_638 [Actinomycetota bacterium]|jgi:malic enzyme